SALIQVCFSFLTFIHKPKVLNKFKDPRISVWYNLSIQPIKSVFLKYIFNHRLGKLEPQPTIKEAEINIRLSWCNTIQIEHTKEIINYPRQTMTIDMPIWIL